MLSGEVADSLPLTILMRLIEKRAVTCRGSFTASFERRAQADPVDDTPRCLLMARSGHSPRCHNTSASDPKQTCGIRPLPRSKFGGIRLRQSSSSAATEPRVLRSYPRLRISEVPRLNYYGY